MANSLTTGVSGLIAHQNMLNVVGNNIANVNTVGYKSQRTLFSDLLYETLRPASTDATGANGGINPSQVGSGVNISQIDRSFSQGNLELTGEEFDFAIEGAGFFSATNGAEQVYTRAGAFALDNNQNLVDPTTGFKITRLGTAGEPTATTSGFQVPGDDSIVIPFGATIPGEETTRLDVSGNLDANADKPLAAVYTSIAAYLAGGVPATMGTALNALDSNVTPYVGGETISFSGRNVDGTAISSSLNVTPATTLGDVVNELNSILTQATAVLQGDGNLVITADNPGISSLAINIEDDPGGGATNFLAHGVTNTTVGTIPDIANSSIEVFDSLGRRHTMNFAYTRLEEDNAWDVTASMDAGAGAIVNPQIGEIRFNDDGSFQQILGLGSGTTSMSVQFNGIATPQQIEVQFGVPGSYDGLTQTALYSAVLSDTDGFSAGILQSVTVTVDGLLNGVASNGRILPVAQLAITRFQNPKGLEALGRNYYRETVNSGVSQRGAGVLVVAVWWRQISWNRPTSRSHVNLPS